MATFAEIISDGKTMSLTEACDIFYGNETPSMTIAEAIEKGIKAGSPYGSVKEILSAIENGASSGVNPVQKVEKERKKKGRKKPIQETSDPSNI